MGSHGTQVLRRGSANLACGHPQNDTGFVQPSLSLRFPSFGHHFRPPSPSTVCPRVSATKREASVVPRVLFARGISAAPPPTKSKLPLGAESMQNVAHRQKTLCRHFVCVYILRSIYVLLSFAWCACQTWKCPEAVVLAYE